MRDSPGIEEARNEALRKIGRNVVNFQKMEGMLKLLNAEMKIEGSVRDLMRLRSVALHTASKQPMGRLADAFLKQIYSAEDRARDSCTENDEVWVSTSFRIEASAEVAKARKRALSAVVSERNMLIHRWLAAFDPNSIVSCKHLSAALDRQHDKVWPELEILQSMIRTFRGLSQELRKQIESGELPLEPEAADHGA
jgi:hypothetical protein